MKFIIFLLIYLSNISYASDSLYTVSATITNIDSVFKAKFQNVEWDSITDSTNYFLPKVNNGGFDQVYGNEGIDSVWVDTITIDDWKRNYFDFYWAIVRYL